MKRRALFPALALLLGGCVKIPDTFAPPEQRKPLGSLEPLAVGHFVNMDDPNAAAHFLADISDALEVSSWRWTGKRPTLRFGLQSTKSLSLRAEFAIAEPTFVHTGPVMVTFLVNGRQLDKIRYDSHGPKEFQKSVPESWLKTGAENIVTLEADKVWTSPEDGARLGLVLTRIGFVQ